MLMLKTETAKNLQTQLEQQKRRMDQEAQKLQTELKHENDGLKKQLTRLQDDDA